MSNEELYSLIVSYLKGDEFSFTLIFDNTKNKVFANIYSYVKNQAVAEDILSETYIKFLSNLKKIKPEQSILGYLYVISRNLSLNYLTRVKRSESLDDYPHLSSSNYMGNGIDYEDIIKVMKKVLSSDMFQVVVMHLVNELDYREIADLMGKKEATIRWLYSQGIKKVKEELNVRQCWK